MLKELAALVIFLSSALFYAGYGQNTGNIGTTKHVMDMPEITKAVAVLHGTKGNNVTGTVTFIKEGNFIKVIADVTGLKPGKHGFHIHEYGDCTSEDGTSAGGHFNPDHSNHGAPSASIRHVGDLGNLEADQNGNAHLELTDSLMSFSGPHSIIGRGIVIHGSEDDMTSQPAGNAGPRVACGVIGIAKP